MTEISRVQMGADSHERKMPSNELSPDDFIKLFLAQLKHQNPMNPTDSSAILQQMSQISSISASKSMQNTLQTMESRMESVLANSQLLQAGNLIGHKVLLESQTGMLDGTGVLKGAAYTKEPLDNITIIIKDLSGNTVRTLDQGPLSRPGLAEFVWDGRDDNGNSCQAGQYQISAVGKVKGNEKDLLTAASFTVKSVSMDSGGNTVLDVDGHEKVTMQDVVSIL